MELCTITSRTVYGVSRGVTVGSAGIRGVHGITYCLLSIDFWGF